jgi:hypothetical protein
LSPEDKLRVHDEIATLYYNSSSQGGGGITHDEAYSMPISMRAFNIRWLINQKEREKQAQEKQANSTTPTPKGPPARISPRNPVK